MCSKRPYPAYQKLTCGSDYALNEVYYGADEELTLNVAYHYLVDTSSELDYGLVDSSLSILNQTFENANISFEAVSVSEIVSDEGHDMPSYVKHARKYNKPDAINIYIYNDIQENFPIDDYGVVGSAGGVPSTFFAIRKSFLKTITSSHEMGHVLGLYHIDTPDIDSTGSSSMTGDKVCDTKAVIRLSETINGNCLYTGPGNYTKEEIKEFACNIMSDAYFKCRGCFSEGQVQRIRWVLEQSQDLRNTIKPKLLPF